MILSLAGLFLPQTARSQEDVAKENVRTAAILKSGTSQDVLISFFQLAAENLTGDNKSFKFQSSLFAIKAKTNDDLWTDNYYLKEKFARNFVITIIPALDKDYKFISNTIGFTYAIVNNRDKTVFDFSKPSDSTILRAQRRAIEEYRKLVTGIDDKNYIAVLNFFATGDGKGLTPEEALPVEFKKILQNEIKGLKDPGFPTLVSFRDHFANQYKSIARYVENRGLLTVKSNFSSLADGKFFSRISLGSEYLKGMLKKNSRMNLELNIIATLDFLDDTATRTHPDLNRQLFKMTGGFNWIIAKTKNYKSLVELKGNLAYNHILNSAYPGEEKTRFTAEGTLRFRITNDIWLPVEISYDPGNGKVFGLFSVKFNFDWLKGKGVK
jgi:hypothetical protein